MPEARAERLRTPSAFRTIQVGDVSITYVPDGYVELQPSLWYQTQTFPASPVVNASGHMVASVGSIVVKEPDGIVVVDAGFGPVTVPGTHTHPSLGDIHGGLNSAYSSHFSDPVLAVAVTHAHDDHVGWLKRQNAHLLEHEIHVGLDDALRLRQLTERSNLRTLLGKEQLTQTVHAISTPGHTAGHMTYIVESAGRRAVLFGDVFHNPLQFKDPALTPWSDELPEAARRSRRLIIEMLREPETVGVGYHFGDVVFGRLKGDEWVPLATS